MTNYKHQYEAMKKMVEEYQDELIPGFRAKIAELETKLKEAEPVRHGRWRKGGYVCGETEWQCSSCGETEWRTSIDRIKWCPFCGAKMDREGKNDTSDI